MNTGPSPFSWHRRESFQHQRPEAFFALAAALMSLAFCAVMAVLTFNFWYEAWENNWRSESMWRARLWIPYAAMPIGLGIISLQYVAEIIKLVTGRSEA